MRVGGGTTAGDERCLCHEAQSYDGRRAGLRGRGHFAAAVCVSVLARGLCYLVLTGQATIEWLKNRQMKFS